MHNQQQDVPQRLTSPMLLVAKLGQLRNFCCLLCIGAVCYEGVVPVTHQLLKLRNLAAREQEAGWLLIEVWPQQWYLSSGTAARTADVWRFGGEHPLTQAQLVLPSWFSAVAWHSAAPPLAPAVQSGAGLDAAAKLDAM